MSADSKHIQDSQSSEHYALLFCSTPSTLPADFIDKLAKQVHDVFPDFKRELISSVIFKNTLKRAPKEHYDISADQNGSIIAWVDTEMLHNYRVYIAAKGGVACEDCKQMFSDCKSLRNIDFNHCLDTSRAASMSGMFEGCCVEQLDLRHFDTSRVTSMSNMFAGCADLEVLDIRSWNTSNVYSMDKMFYRCVRLSPDTEKMITALDQSKVVSAILMVTETPFENSLLPLELTGHENFRKKVPMHNLSSTKGCRKNICQHHQSVYLCRPTASGYNFRTWL